MDLFIIVKSHNLRHINYGFKWDHPSNPGGESYSTDHVLQSWTSSDGLEQGSVHCRYFIAIFQRTVDFSPDADRAYFPESEENPSIKIDLTAALFTSTLSAMNLTLLILNCKHKEGARDVNVH